MSAGTLPHFSLFVIRCKLSDTKVHAALVTTLDLQNGLGLCFSRFISQVVKSLKCVFQSMSMHVSALCLFQCPITGIKCSDLRTATKVLVHDALVLFHRLRNPAH